MEGPTVFIFRGWKIKKSNEIIFSYQIDNPPINEKSILFKEKIILPNQISHQNSNLLTNVLNNLSLILGISYWKLFSPKTIEIKHFSLSKEQAKFWNIVYTKGLGEFFYQNQINYRKLVNFPFNKKAQIKLSKKKFTPRGLLGVGGGKDSIVAIEELKKKKINFHLFALYHSKKNQIIENVAKKSNHPRLIVYRIIDQKLLDFNQKKIGYNGHVPFSATLSFVQLLLAVLYDYQSLYTANEKSANEGNLIYLNEEINHQWSKSEEYEKLFNHYIHEFITPNINYQSIIRHLTENQIAEKFSHLSKYFFVFSSCNRNFKINHQSNKLWCSRCPKCLFTYLILAPYLSKETLYQIFKKNLLNDKSLLPLFQQLLGKEGNKPFECVGTEKDVQKSLSLLLQNKDFKNDYLVKFFRNEI